ncbi:Binding-protein-dependent transport systems inner membrane component [Paraburkholderia ribeironis]|uniref:Maltose/maltodextrin transport system permease protein MalG n=1 Tax=Paraburkholderia ribeironis TaxID=1247936 RepID=A0A1N7SB41_9BURK|nr:carbohydrate ABC transporter permease [Paraburkholderia ribeironis]SIT44616.1 Binding-protein-dependent transport systems inner membrane component [Paraburkholderia ribeironis]
MNDVLNSSGTDLGTGDPASVVIGQRQAHKNEVYAKHRKRVATSLHYLACSVLMFVFLFPIAWAAFTSLYPSADANASPPKYLPSHLSFENYLNLAAYGVGIWRYLGNSASVSGMTVTMTLVLSTLGGYGFSRFRFRGRNLIFVIILATLMIPFQSILNPLFVLLRWMHIQGTLFGLSLVYTTFQLPFAVFMMRNSFDAVPREIEEAARIDGCNSLQSLRMVMLPLVLPGLVTAGLFAFFGSWNELLAALILINDSTNYTLPVMLLNAQSGQLGAIDWGLMQAGITISILPCAVLFLLLQRFYIHGMIAGAIKA